MANFMKTGKPENTVFEKEDFPFNIFNVHNATTLSHWHNHLEFVVIEEGQCQIEVNGDRFACQQGDVILISPGCLHSIVCTEGIYAAIVIGDQLLKEVMLDHYTHKVVGKFMDGLYENYRVFRNNGLREKLLNLRNELESETAGYQMMIIHGLCLIFLDIYRVSQLSEDKAPINQSVQYVKKALIYIDEHYTEKIMLEDVSRLNNLSKQHFAREFKAYTGKTFMDYLTLYRLDMSNWYLKHTDMPITRIPEHIGFCNANYYTRVYKQHYGETPREVRKVSRT